MDMVIQIIYYGVLRICRCKVQFSDRYAGVLPAQSASPDYPYMKLHIARSKLSPGTATCIPALPRQRLLSAVVVCYSEFQNTDP